MKKIKPNDKLISFVSLRVKMLLLFTIVFSGVFAVAYYWFYQFATNTALRRIKVDLLDTMQAAARGVNGDELLALSKMRESRPGGYRDVTDPRYWEHVKWLATVERIEPRAYVYTYVQGPNPNSVVFVGSGSAANTDRDFEGAKFLEYYEPKTTIHQGLTELTVRDKPYKDDWGSWITGYSPLENQEGEKVAAIGVDFEASYVNEVQEAVRGRIFVAFSVTYGTLFILVLLISGVITKPIANLTKAAEKIGEGEYDLDFSSFIQRRFSDEIGTLASVFDLMVEKVRKREEKLKEQVKVLKIEIDQVKRKQQVDSIVDSDFFQDLQAKARELRGRNRTKK
ncbi:MAG: HAMP domain-containing protein [Spirulina sp.]